MNKTCSTVKALREELGLSQQAFAVELGVSIRAVANWENDRPPRGKYLALILSLATSKGSVAISGMMREAILLNCLKESGLRLSKETIASALRDYNL